MPTARDLSRSPARVAPASDVSSVVVAGVKMFPQDSCVIGGLNLSADFHVRFRDGTLRGGHKSGPAESAPGRSPMQGPNDGVESLRLMLRVELLFEPRSNGGMEQFPGKHA